jgi:1,4-dihydroxy-2-naphthoate octaprenyltransferase
MPLAYVGLGDLFVLLFFGFAAVLGSAWVQQPVPPPWPWVAAAAAVGLQATALIAINNLRDIPTDARTGKRTLAVRLGDRATRAYHLGLHLAAAACWLAAGLWPCALAALVGGGLLAALVWRTQGAALNRCLPLAGLLQLLCAGLAVLTA